MRYVLPISMTVATIAMSSAAFASADCTAYPEDQWIAKDAFAQQLEAQGYTIKKLKKDDNCYELYGTDAAGHKVEIYFDMKTGDIVKQEIED